MKKLNAVLALGLLALGVASGVVTMMEPITAKAFPAIIYRTRFRPIQTPCWESGFISHIDGTSTQVPDNSAYTYTINQGDYLFIDLQAGCCDGTQHQVGYQWTEQSSDGGQTWGLVSPTFIPTYIPAGYWSGTWHSDANYILQNTGGNPCH